MFPRAAIGMKKLCGGAIGEYPAPADHLACPVPDRDHTRGWVDLSLFNDPAGRVCGSPPALARSTLSECRNAFDDVDGGSGG